MSSNEQPLRIHKLPQVLANQIAAGEVIERPASIVKELLENSLDASATIIDIDVQKGGSQLIRVTDNGLGIHADDIKLALQRHATSKLHKQSDLSGISSLGFRGEALPSIASIAQFKLTSRYVGCEQAWTLSLDPMLDGSDYTPSAHPPGTTIEIRNLFHAIPARRKFLRTERTEFLHILEIVRYLALSRFGVTMRLSHNGKTVLSCRNAQHDLTQRIENIMGRAFSRQALALDYTVDTMRLWGWLGTAELSRNQTDRQYFYLNGRMVRDKRVNHAIRLAFDDDLPAGRYPSYVLYLQMDATATDVNVHPTKQEVRFRDARNVHDFVYASLRSSLNEDQQLYRRDSGGNIENSGVVQANVNQRLQPMPGQRIKQATAHYGALLGAGSNSPSRNGLATLGQAVSHVHGRFIISKRDETFVLIDVHAAKRHIFQTGLRTAAEDDAVRHRPLLVPVNIKVSEQQANRLAQHSGLLKRLGLSLDRMSIESVIVRSMPASLQDADIQALIADILLRLDEHTEADESLQADIISIMARHVCDAASQSLTVDEMMNVLRALDSTGIDTGACQHAAIWRSLDVQDMESIIREA
ncbi:MAG: DNA mismatch repair endonuclease MutL [Proteobacteria bacterium]|nr:DNA mismatch repair endonuclease MutL [Pseudomonadota bacterium]